ncbi:MAG: aminodeoxychorismate/anthranilate synthase component II [Myxococcota bacterium]
MILVVDNYDSFTFNLVQYLLELGAEVEVHRHDAPPVASVDAVRRLAPRGVLLGPGPGRPGDAGITPALADGALGLPVLGVCLGHQAIGEAFGARIVHAQRLMHGRTSPVVHDGRGVFRGLPSPFTATRYHSLVVDAASLPACLEVSARSDDEEIMGLRHRELPLEGVQFHPESFLTEHGHALLRSWLEALP